MAGTAKSRTARALLAAARHRGHLAPGQPIQAVSSGSLGRALAAWAVPQGHPVTILLSASTPGWKVAAIEARGATVVVVPSADGDAGRTTGADLRRAQQVAAERRAPGGPDHGAWCPSQLTDPAAVAVHVHVTAAQLRRQLPRVDAVVATVGSGAGLAGLWRGLRHRWPTVKAVAAEPATAAILGTGRVEDPRHALSGAGLGFVPPHLRGIRDALHPESVTDVEARHTAEALRRLEGLAVGPSTGAAVAAARRWLGSGRARDVVVCMMDAPPG